VASLRGAQVSRGKFVGELLFFFEQGAPQRGAAEALAATQQAQLERVFQQHLDELERGVVGVLRAHCETLARLRESVAKRKRKLTDVDAYARQLKAAQKRGAPADDIARKEAKLAAARASFEALDSELGSVFWLVAESRQTALNQIVGAFAAAEAAFFVQLRERVAVATAPVAAQFSAAHNPLTALTTLTPKIAEMQARMDAVSDATPALPARPAAASPSSTAGAAAAAVAASPPAPPPRAQPRPPVGAPAVNRDPNPQQDGRQLGSQFASIHQGFTPSGYSARGEPSPLAAAAIAAAAPSPSPSPSPAPVAAAAQGEGEGDGEGDGEGVGEGEEAVGFVVAAYPFEAQSAAELSFAAGDRIRVLSTDDAEWWLGELRGRQGYFPHSYVSR
jgi:hypothetical protein